jgi:hypothetical protein
MEERPMALSTYDKAEQSRASASFYFGKKSAVQPKGILDLNLKDDITMLIKGRLTTISLPTAQSYEQRSRIELILTSCRIVGPEKKVSLEDAIQAAKKKVS